MLGRQLHRIIDRRLGVHHALPAPVGLDPGRAVVHHLFGSLGLVAARRHALLHAVGQDAHGIGRKLHLHVAELEGGDHHRAFLGHLAVHGAVELERAMAADHHRGLGQQVGGGSDVLIDHGLPELGFQIDEGLARGGCRGHGGPPVFASNIHDAGLLQQRYRITATRCVGAN